MQRVPHERDADPVGVERKQLGKGEFFQICFLHISFVLMSCNINKSTYRAKKRPCNRSL
jgi:hypothetical protein